MRQYDPTYGRFMSVDPLWAKYAPLQPYHYAGNEPVARLDPSGMDYDVIIDEESGTATVSAKYFVKESDKTRLEDALNKIRELTGTTVSVNGKAYCVTFDLTTVVVEDPVIELNQSVSTELVDGNGMIVENVPYTNTNSFETNNLPSNIAGLTTGGRLVAVNPKADGFKDPNASVHEILHSLGVGHNLGGVMTESLKDVRHSATIYDGLVTTIVNGSDKGNDPSLGKRTVKRASAR